MKIIVRSWRYGWGQPQSYFSDKEDRCQHRNPAKEQRCQCGGQHVNSEPDLVSSDSEQQLAECFVAHSQSTPEPMAPLALLQFVYVLAHRGLCQRESSNCKAENVVGTEPLPLGLHHSDSYRREAGRTQTADRH
jgi:hypothetical protein